MKKIELNLNDEEKLVEIAKALASDIRVRILNELNKSSYNVVELAELLHIPVSTAAFNVKILENAGLIRIKIQASSRGSMKLCSRRVDKVEFYLAGALKTETFTHSVSMPIGSFYDFKVGDVCGIAGERSIIEKEDDPSSFYSPDRHSAQLIWFSDGYLEYKFPLPKMDINNIEFTMELCAEAPNYCEDWPSDLTMWINGKEVGTFLCPGDFGARRGALNPPWWPTGSTQYGLLKKWTVNKSGAYIDNIKTSDCTVQDLNLKTNNHVDMRIGIKTDAVNKGGMNLFGRKFGDFAQDIVMRVDGKILDNGGNEIQT